MNRRLHAFPITVLSALVLFAAAPARAQDNSVAANQEVRIQQLEGQIRALNGQLEQMNFRVQQLNDRLDKLVADVDFRLRQMGEAGYAVEVHAELPPQEEERIRYEQKFTSPPGTLLFEVPMQWLPARDEWIGDTLRAIAARARNGA